MLAIPPLSLSKAVINEDFAQVLLLIGKKANVNAPDENGLTPLMHCRTNKTTDILDFLIENNANIHAKDPDGHSAFWWAVTYSNPVIILKLAVQGVNVDTELMRMTKKGDLVMTRCLVEAGGSILAANSEGETALSLANQNSNKEIGNYFIEVLEKEQAALIRKRNLIVEKYDKLEAELKTQLEEHEVLFEERVNLKIPAKSIDRPAEQSLVFAKKTYPDGSVYEGQFLGEQRCGQGTQTFLDGRVYEGQWKNDKQNGRGKRTGSISSGLGYSSYIGNFKDNKADGQGILTLNDGVVLEGEWKESKFDGYGKRTFPKGHTYEGVQEGQWRDFKLNGPGKVVWGRNGTERDGCSFIGNWKDDYYSGQGKLTLDDGSYYIGEFKESKFDGSGVLHKANGSKHVSNFWKDNCINGYGKVVNPLENWVYEGECRGGHFDGRGKMLWADGDSYEGEYRDDKPNGQGTLIKNGKVHTGRFVNGSLGGGCVIS